MKISLKKAWLVAKINFRVSKLTYIFTIVLALAGSASLIQSWITQSQSICIDIGNYLYIAVVLNAIFIPVLNFKRIMNLNGKKIDYFWGVLINYTIVAAVVSFVNILLFLMWRETSLNVLNLVQVFGWINHGITAAFIQQFCFLLLISLFTHTLTSMQTFLAGWITDIVIISIISIFTPIASLRKVLVWFFNMIIFNNNALI